MAPARDGVIVDRLVAIPFRLRQGVDQIADLREQASARSRGRSEAQARRPARLVAASSRGRNAASNALQD